MLYLCSKKYNIFSDTFKYIETINKKEEVMNLKESKVGMWESLEEEKRRGNDVNYNLKT